MKDGTASTRMQRSFQGISPDAARQAVSSWLSDFTEHGPFKIHEIRTDEQGAHFVATVTYSEAGTQIVAPSSTRMEPEKPSAASAAEHEPNWSLLRLARAKGGKAICHIHTLLHKSANISSGASVAEASNEKEESELLDDVIEMLDASTSDVWRPLGKEASSS